MAPSHRYNTRSRAREQSRIAEQEPLQEASDETDPSQNEGPSEAVPTTVEEGSESDESDDEMDEDEVDSDTEDKIDSDAEDEDSDQVDFVIESSNGRFKTCQTTASQDDDMWAVANGLIASIKMPKADDVLNDYVINVNGHYVEDGDEPPHGCDPGRMEEGSIGHWIADGAGGIYITLLEHEKEDEDE
ncbi:uncharacterized protein AB675_10689 [Cyphellophora attinorum]|uniref:Uncharacterized protein n=1 Tax=Cyphellophora attinorum TaxID=1664694 RepID=A0A0N0NN30_9EURO|nr:uncharacterized protein AB675_10689 [Phialophora attinorum]KPI40909.1 hypothetical protein AB675_10689 [Phialophora attinorum]